MSEYSNYRKPASHSNPYYSSQNSFKDNLRVLKRNLLFCSGLPSSLTEYQLKSHHYFGKYGTVLKVTLLKNIRQMSVYVTYANSYEASLAIIATNNFQMDRYHKLASIYGTIKYCKYFLKKIQCKNLPNCNYLHLYDKKNQIYINNQLPDEVFEQHYNIAIGILREVDARQMIKEKGLIANSDKNEDVLPCPIEALSKIVRDKQQSIQIEQKDEISCNNGEQEGQQEEKSENSSCEASHKSISGRETYQTVGSETIEEGGIQNEDFPKIQSFIQSEREQAKQKEKSHRQERGLKQRESEREQLDEQWREKSKISNQKSLAESVEVKLIRRMLREEKSRLGVWTEGRGEHEVRLFDKGLEELNELREMCEWQVLKQRQRQEERVKFLMIKNLHQRPNTPNQHSPRHETKGPLQPQSHKIKKLQNKIPQHDSKYPE